MEHHRTNLPCPDCGARMLACVDEGATYRGCDACGGVWLDRVASRRLLAAELSNDVREFVRRIAEGDDTVADPYRAPARSEARTCPICMEPLSVVRLQSPNVAIDACSEHGAYLDRGELGAIWAEASLQARAVHARKTRK